MSDYLTAALFLWAAGLIVAAACLTRYLCDLRAYHAAEQEDADNQARWDLDEDAAAKRLRDMAFGYDVDGGAS